MPVLARPSQQSRSAGQVVCRLSPTGIWQPNHRPITPTISALPGEFAAMAMCRDDCAGVGLCSLAARRVVVRGLR